MADIALPTAHMHRYAAMLVNGEASPFHGDCEKPIVREMRGVGSHVLTRLRQWRDDPDLDEADGRILGEFQRTPSTLCWVSVRCRQCEACLAHRGRLWSARAMSELGLASRSWFGTLTLSPEQQFRARCIADTYVQRKRCEPLSSLTTSEQFTAIVGAISPEITKWLKRVRKKSGARFRYLLVSEAHKSGAPHFHLLLHETGLPVVKSLLEKEWRLGFSHWRLVHDGKAAFYATKYLSKSALTRVRASQRYGRDLSRLTEHLCDALQVSGIGRSLFNEGPLKMVQQDFGAPF